MNKTQIESKIEEIKEYLVKKGVDIERLAAVFVGNTMDCIVGEISDEVGESDLVEATTFIFDDAVLLKNPMRMLRRQTNDRGGVTIEHHLVEMDRVLEGVISLKVVGGFFFGWLNGQSQLNYYGLVYGFHKAREMMNSRITIPRPHLEMPDLGR
jgi:hypothetical protein